MKVTTGIVATDGNQLASIGMIKDFIDEYARYKTIAEKAIAQVSEAEFSRVVSPDNNSIATLIKHIGGNLRSRFTEFLTSDGEKPWRERDSEFEYHDRDRAQLMQLWSDGWEVLNSELSKLTEEQLLETVYIRGRALTVSQALCRSLAHVSYHVGQIVFLARIFNAEDWKWISIPKGRSSEYNQNPTKEKKPE